MARLIVAVLFAGVLAFSLPQPGAQDMSDRDDDGLLDTWETTGLDADFDGDVDVDLPAMGANPRRKDIFIECDFMTLDLNTDGDASDPGEHTHKPLEAAVDRFVRAFANAPVSNPDGSFGITAHVDTGQLGGGNAIPHFFELDFSGQTHGHRMNPAIATNGTVRVVVWEDDRDNNGYSEIFAQRIAANGTLNGNEMTVNSTGDGQQRNPVVAMDGAGNFTVAWEDDQDGNGYYQVMARGFMANGNALFADLTVNTEGDGQQRNPTIAMDPMGNFVVAWEDDQDENGFYQILMRGFNADGTQRFSDRTVNSLGDGQQRKPAIAMDGLGRFVVTWEDDQDGNGFYQIMARGFSANGGSRFNDITVNSVDDGQQRRPAIAMDAVGRFVVAWEDDQDGNGFFQILARGFEPAGTASFADITVNTVSDGQQLKPAIGLDAGANFVVAWEDDQDENGFWQVLARGFNSNGTQRFATLTVNGISTDNQQDPAVAGVAGGGVVIAWEDDRDANNFWEVFVRGLNGNGGASVAELLGHGKGTSKDFYAVKDEHFDPRRRPAFHYCLFVHNRISTGSSGIAKIDGVDLIVSLGSFSNQVGSVTQQSNTLMHELGHNLNLRHGGSEGKNRKPNYNSVMNYRYQFPGVDTDCDATGNGVLDYSEGLLPPLQETALNEVAGMCNGFVRINAVSAGQQRTAAVASDAAGNFVVAWEDDRDGNGVLEIWMRGFMANGSERFSERKANSESDGQQRRPAIAMRPDGTFVVAWEDDQDENGLYQILMRGFTANGAQRFADRTVNTVAAGQQLKPAIAMDNLGRFVVTWEDDQDENGYYQIMARGFFAAGTQRFADITVNSEDDGQQRKPAIAMDTAGRFVVAWEDDQDDNGFYQIMTRGFTATGTQRFADITVNTVSDGQQLRPAIGMDANGNFVVAWEDDLNENGFYEIHARGFAANGTQRFGTITVNTSSSGQQLRPAVTMNAAGEFLVAWQDDQDQNGSYEILARSFTAVGAQVVPQLRVNIDSSGQQLQPRLSNGAAVGVFVWEDDADSNGVYEVYGRMLDFSGNPLNSVSIDWNGDGNFQNNVSFDINDDDSQNELSDSNDWSRLKLKVMPILAPPFGSF
jgi:hypothetical protein